MTESDLRHQPTGLARSEAGIDGLIQRRRFGAASRRIAADPRLAGPNRAAALVALAGHGPPGDALVWARHLLFSGAAKDDLGAADISETARLMARIGAVDTAIELIELGQRRWGERLALVEGQLSDAAATPQTALLGDTKELAAAMGQAVDDPASDKLQQAITTAHSSAGFAHQRHDCLLALAAMARQGRHHSLAARAIDLALDAAPLGDDAPDLAFRSALEHWSAGDTHRAPLTLRTAQRLSLDRRADLPDWWVDAVVSTGGRISSPEATGPAWVAGHRRLELPTTGLDMRQLGDLDAVAFALAERGGARWTSTGLASLQVSCATGAAVLVEHHAGGSPRLRWIIDVEPAAGILAAVDENGDSLLLGAAEHQYWLTTWRSRGLLITPRADSAPLSPVASGQGAARRQPIRLPAPRLDLTADEPGRPPELRRAELRLRLEDLGHSDADAVAAFHADLAEVTDRIGPTSWASRLAAELAERCDDLTSAACAWSEVVALDPTDAGAHLALGRLAAVLGQSEVAFESARRAATLAPADPDTQLALGSLADGEIGSSSVALEIAGALGDSSNDPSIADTPPHPSTPASDEATPVIRLVDPDRFIDEALQHPALSNRAPRHPAEPVGPTTEAIDLTEPEERPGGPTPALKGAETNTMTDRPTVTAAATPQSIGLTRASAEAARFDGTDQRTQPIGPLEDWIAYCTSAGQSQITDLGFEPDRWKVALHRAWIARDLGGVFKLADVGLPRAELAESLIAPVATAVASLGDVNARLVGVERLARLVAHDPRLLEVVADVATDHRHHALAVDCSRLAGAVDDDPATAAWRLVCRIAKRSTTRESHRAELDEALSTVLSAQPNARGPRLLALALTLDSAQDASPGLDALRSHDAFGDITRLTVGDRNWRRSQDDLGHLAVWLHKLGLTGVAAAVLDAIDHSERPELTVLAARCEHELDDPGAALEVLEGLDQQIFDGWATAADLEITCLEQAGRWADAAAACRRRAAALAAKPVLLHDPWPIHARAAILDCIESGDDLPEGDLPHRVEDHPQVLFMRARLTRLARRVETSEMRNRLARLAPGYLEWIDEGG